MGGKSSNRARRRHLSDSVEKLPDWERELLWEENRRQITRLNQECREIAQKSRPKKKKVPKVQMVAEKGQGALQSHGAQGHIVPDYGR